MRPVISRYLLMDGKSCAYAACLNSYCVFLRYNQEDSLKLAALAMEPPRVRPFTLPRLGLTRVQNGEVPADRT